jgi:dTDP-4-dehydrorhamnose 3,5-epimerase
MKILEVNELAIREVKVIRVAKFRDARGYFFEHYRRSTVDDLPFLQDLAFVQANSSFSRAGTIRGLHFQWNPYMGKLVRTVHGRMVDLVLDIRKATPTFGCMLAYDMPVHDEYADLIWVPPGFAHGNVFPQDTYIEYLCTGEYNPSCEAGISPLAPDIDWSLCAPDLKRLFETTAANSPLMTDKDRSALTVGAWEKDPRSENFII